MAKKTAPRPFTIERRIYYADTDAGGVVHHGTYVRLLEQGRTEWAHKHGLKLKRCEELGVVFVVASLSINYRKPLHLDDEIEITVSLSSQRNSSSVFEHQIHRGGELVCDCEVRLVCVRTEDGKVVPIPEELRRECAV